MEKIKKYYKYNIAIDYHNRKILKHSDLRIKYFYLEEIEGELFDIITGKKVMYCETRFNGAILKMIKSNASIVALEKVPISPSDLLEELKDFDERKIKNYQFVFEQIELLTSKKTKFIRERIKREEEERILCEQQIENFKAKAKSLIQNKK